MIDNEQLVYDEVSYALRARFEGIFIIGAELTDNPPQFPAVSIVQKNSEVNQRHSTFDSVENAVIEEYEFGMYSNLEDIHTAKEQTKEIMGIIDGVMERLFYPRTFCQPIPSADAKITRRIARYKKTDVV